MALEDKIDALTAEMKRVGDLLEKNGAGGGSGGGAAATTPGKKTGKTGPKNTAEQMKAAVMKVKDEKSSEMAKSIIEKFAGSGKKLADLANLPDKFDAVVAACEEALSEEDGGGDADEI